MKKILIGVFVLAISLYSFNAHAVEYYTIPPKEPLKIIHRWEFTDKEVKNALISILMISVDIPEGKQTIWHSLLGGGYMFGSKGIDIVITEIVESGTK